MKSHWRKLISFLPLAIEKKIYRSHFQALHHKWVEGDQKLPPSHLQKQNTIKKYATANNLTILVETGTYLGDMVFAMQDQFDEIYSIELSSHFYQKAKARFAHSKHIKLLEGDSGKVLHQLVPQLTKPALFWLDGHYSGGKTAKGEKECPIYEELNNIFSSPLQHTIIIDDARLFIGEHDYPTIEQLKVFVTQQKPQSVFHFENDAIIINAN